MSIVIRRARPGDHLLIRELQQEIAALHYEGRPDLFQKEGRFYSEEEFARLLADPEDFIWIAEEDGSVVGYAFALVQRARKNATFRDFNRFYIDDVCVSSACQRQGIGRMLMDECKRQARLSHCHTIDLGVWSFNQNAIAFYESCGLKEREKRMELILPDEAMIDVSELRWKRNACFFAPFGRMIWRICTPTLAWRAWGRARGGPITPAWKPAAGCWTALFEDTISSPLSGRKQAG